jgi:energy-converting hydrogenase Eha subunit A
MDELNEKDIAALLRLKRYEQPPSGYFENFLHEFHRRQRDELLRKPLWRISLERAHDFMLRLNVPALGSYPAAVTAALICAAVISLKVYQTPEPARISAHAGPALTAPVNATSELTLASPVATRVFSTQSLRHIDERARAHRAAAPPRYVLDSIPVSYESTFRF